MSLGLQTLPLTDCLFVEKILFVCFLLKSKKVLNLNWVCRVHIPFFYITLTGVSNDIFHPHVFFLMLKRDIYMKYYIFLYIYLYVYIYIFMIIYVIVYNVLAML